MKSLLIFFFITLPALGQFDWQGHRGARGLYPENTINGMKEALKYPVTTLELDVVMSKDMKVVVSGEPWFNEEICGKQKERNLFKLTYQQIAKIDCGSRPHPRFPQQQNVPEFKPLLHDLLMNLKASEKNFNIEIKSSEDNERIGYQPEIRKFADEVVKVILNILPRERFTIQSFDWRVLKYLKEKYPDIRLSALRESPYKVQDVLKELGFRPDIFSPDYRLLTAADVASFHEHGIKVIPWTINNTNDMKKVIGMNVDGIITDYPNLISEIPLELTLAPDCPKGFHRFEGNCVKVPKHAVPSVQNPGWVCKSGYQQKRDSCIKINIPENAVLLDDGKTWVCRDGFKRYRFKCIKVDM